MTFCKTCEESDLDRVFLDRDGVLSSLSGGPGMWAHTYEDSWWVCTKEAAYAVEGYYYCAECFSKLLISGEVRDYDPITSGDFPAEPVSCEHCETEDVFYRTTYTVLDLSDESWLIPWPTELGHYWFHGWEYGDDGSSPKTFLVEVFRTILNHLVYLTGGRVICKSEACGVWRPRPAVLPTPPQTSKGEV